MACSARSVSPVRVGRVDGLACSVETLRESGRRTTGAGRWSRGSRSLSSTSSGAIVGCTSSSLVGRMCRIGAQAACWDSQGEYEYAGSNEWLTESGTCSMALRTFAMVGRRVTDLACLAALSTLRRTQDGQRVAPPRHGRPSSPGASHRHQHLKTIVTGTGIRVSPIHRFEIAHAWSESRPTLAPRLPFRWHATRSTQRTQRRPPRWQSSLRPDCPGHLEGASLRSLSRWALFAAVTLHRRLLRNLAGGDAAPLLAAYFASPSASSFPKASMCPGTQRMTTSSVASCAFVAASSLS